MLRWPPGDAKVAGDVPQRGLWCGSEENIWKLCEHVKHSSPHLLPHCFPVFISNPREMVTGAVLGGNQGDGNWGSVGGSTREMFPQYERSCWQDYHVILVYHSPQEALVYDLDTELSFPSPLSHYCRAALRNNLKPQFHRWFRVIPAEVFLSTFASDRSRMKSPDGTWLKPPPPYPCLSTPESTNNLEDFISMDPGRGPGQVLSQDGLMRRFSSST
ncbi:WDYHV1 [Cordylochernes scorpioides]|uniref:Protein N-terminal glutamine amidohydrolase n=1 Tax=Cordylochernes scorpioides TaxID=51811 RepID=A0ABY6K0E7_9ARAC|nr:WDYHV1 [Cordylochernes scorpioides]